MILIFVDETGDVKFKNYFGISVAVVNANFYRAIKKEFQNIITSEGWDPGVEFKGSCLFSASSGCENISVEKRIDIASKILQLNTSRQNRRMKFHYLCLKSEDHRTEYLRALPFVLNRALPKATKKGGKDLLPFIVMNVKI